MVIGYITKSGHLIQQNHIVLILNKFIKNKVPKLIHNTSIIYTYNG